MWSRCAMAEAKFDAVKFSTALIVGAGSGLSAALARLLAQDGYTVALAARSTDDLAALVTETGARAFACDATSRQACSIPMRSQPPTCTSSISPTAPGPPRSRCGRGWRNSKEAGVRRGNNILQIGNPGGAVLW